jgi:Family of unknown function (DUF6356)
MKNLRAYIIQHLKDCNWTYFEHFHHAMVECWMLTKITFKGFVHGFIPWVWSGYAPVEIYKMYKRMRKLRHNQIRYDAVDREEVEVNKQK